MFKMRFASDWHDTSKAFAYATREPLSGDFEGRRNWGSFTGLSAAQTGQVEREGSAYRGEHVR